MSDTEAQRRPRPRRSVKAQIADYAKKPVVWVGVVLVGAIAAGFTSWSEPRISAFLDGVFERGDPVLVNADVESPSSDMWLETPAALTDQQLAELSGRDISGQLALLEDEGAVMFGARDVNVILTGNRSGGVRITDLRPVSDCSPLGPGTLIKLLPAIGGVADTQRMVVVAEDPSKPPKNLDPEAGPDGMSRHDYFDVKNITLEDGEQESLLVSVVSRNSVCSVDLEITLVEGQEEYKQRVLGDENRMVVAPWSLNAHDQSITKVYAGGPLCERYVEIPPDEAMSVGSPEVCGSDNAGTYWSNPLVAVQPSTPAAPTG